MIRGSTLMTLGVVLGLACVFGQRRLEFEKREESQSVLVDIDPKVNVALDDKDQTEDNKEDNPAEHVSDPFWFWKSRKRRRKCRKSRYRRRPCPTRKPYPPHKPYPTHKPHTPTQACSTSRPTGIQWDNVWRGKLFVECPRGKS